MFKKINYLHLTIFSIIIVLALALRLYRINLPLLEFYSIRQIYTADIARNILKSNFNILYPQVSFMGPGPVYSILEFPLYSTIVAIFYYLFGEFEVFGRLLSILFFLLSSFVVYQISKNIYGFKTGLIALFLFNLYPLGILVSRSFMPDNLMLLFSLLSIWYAFKIHERFTTSRFLILCGLICLTILTKFQGFFTLVPVCYLLLTGKGELKPRIQRTVIMLVLSLFLPFFWYLRDFLISIYGSSQYFKLTIYGTSIKNFFDANFYRSIFRILYSSLTQLGLLLLVLGFLLKGKRNETFLKFWVLGLTFFFLVFNNHSGTHEYYHLAVLPIAAIFGAKVLNLFSNLIGKHIVFSKNIALAITLLIFAYFSIASVLDRAYVVGSRFLPVIGASNLVKQYTQISDSIIAADDVGGQTIYYSNRRGWYLNLAQEKNPWETAQGFVNQGVRYLIYIPTATVNSGGFLNYLYSNFGLIDKGKNYFLFSLVKPINTINTPSRPD